MKRIEQPVQQVKIIEPGPTGAGLGVEAQSGHLKLCGGGIGTVAIERIRLDLQGMCEVPGLTAGDILALPEALKCFLRWIILSKAVTCEQVAACLGGTERGACSLVNELATLGLLERLPICGVPRYRVCLIPRSLRPPPELLNMSEK